ncbi:polyprenyl diphosphate synthase [Nocardia sp. NPDC050175]|uniref:polyprenyl diphosphate synthase n=1 Tax=Nocardia sp. NPDC050175 TaxID=3364317 RepID=UPI00379BC459
MNPLSQLDPDHLPRHIACIPDGNGRWARQHGDVRIKGHSAGEQVISDVALGADDLGIEWFTLYVFSTENWQRPEAEVAYLMSTIERGIYRRLDEYQRRNIRIRWIGRPDPRIPRNVRAAIDHGIAMTENNIGMTLTIAFNYGGRTEIADAVRRMIDDGVTGAAVDSALISRYLYAPDMPDPDLVIRTSGENRISNFLLWQLAYSELVFTPVLWPDFTFDHLVAAIQEYQRRTRRFGRLDAEVAQARTPSISFS